MSWYNPLSDIRSVTNQLGITQAPPPNLADPSNPAYQSLVNAAQTFNTNYGQAAKMAQADRAAATSGNTQEQQTIDQLRAAASGAPTAATNLMRQQTDQNARNAINAAAAFEGTNPGEALRAGLSSAQQTQIASTAAGAANAAQEQEAARQTLAGATAANQGAGLQQYSTGAGAMANAANAFNSANQAPFAAQTGQQTNQINANAANSAAMGSLLGGAGKAIAASDPELKTDVHDGRKMSDEFLDSLAPKEFHYKNPGAPGQEPGQRLGVMADELPRHDVVTGPDGKKWISATAISDILGGLGRVHQRLSAVEAARAFA